MDETRELFLIEINFDVQNLHPSQIEVDSSINKKL